MGLKIAPAEVKRWEAAGLIPAANPPRRRTPRLHQQANGERNPGSRVVLPLAGVKLVSRSNAREHWSTRHARDKREAEQVRAAWTLAGLTGWPVPLPVAVTLTRIGGKPMDGDNLQSSLKAIRDAIAKLIGTDDGDGRIRWRYKQRPASGTPTVTIIIRPRNE